MKEEKIKIEELNGIDILKLIYEEIKNTRIELKGKIESNYKELKNEMDNKFNYLDEKIDNTQNTLVKEISEEIKNVRKELNDKFNYLDEKIDNTQNTLVKEISEELKTFYQMDQDSTNNLNKKIDDEIENRKVDVSKIKEFNKIIINDIRSRVSILEEENEKYNLN